MLRDITHYAMWPAAFVAVAGYVVVASIAILVAFAADVIWHDLTTPYERYPEARS